MNLLDKKLGLLLIVALTLFACEEELSTINLGPENNLGIFFGEISLADNVSQVWAGSATSSYKGQLLAGYYQDPVFGDVRATAYGDISVANSALDSTAIASANFISLSLNLRINDASGTYNTNDSQTLELYRLSSPIDGDLNSNSSKDLPLAEKIGEAQFKLHKDSIEYVLPNDPKNPQTSSFYDGNRRYIYKTKFTLTPEFKSLFFNTFKNAVINDSLKNFNYYLDQNLKGLAIVAKDQNNAVIAYNVVDTASIIKLKYSKINNSGVRDTTSARFNLNSLKSYSKIEPNEDTPWSNSVFNGITEINSPFKTNDGNAYLQSGTNMFLALDLSGFRNFKDTLNNGNSEHVLIQRAELILDNIIDPGSNIKLPTVLGLHPSSSDSISNGSFNFIDNVNGDLLLNGNYSSDANQYSVILPLYLQSIIDNKTPYDQLVLEVNITQNNNGSLSIPNLRDNSTKRFVVKKEDIKIRYYYSIPDKN
ncbi:MAG TPA: hypothetical protein PKL31_05570 [Fulvivirga sp.]|nr:hypothetical protein [Fulvivirga sp.]